jgi:Flp pilus assembly protein TadG
VSRREEYSVSAMKFLEWLGIEASAVPRDQRYPRKLTASYWNGGTSTGAEVRDISESGAYLITSERWYPGTILSLTLQCEASENGTKKPQTMTVLCKIARHEQDGMGVYFMFAGSKDRKALQHFIAHVPSRETPPVASNEGGQSLIEFALLLPILFVLIFNMVNFSGFLYSMVTVSNAARVGAQYASLGGAYATNPASPSLSDLTTMIRNETLTLPNSSTTNPAFTATVNVNGTCYAYPQTSTSTSITCPTGVAHDPESVAGAGSFYSLIAVDVTYTYTPFVSGLSITPPTSIHIRQTMRMLN